MTTLATRPEQTSRADKTKREGGGRRMTDDGTMTGAGGTVRLVRPAERTPADPTPGMQREQAFAVPGLWAGVVHTEPGASSGWHHHGEHETSLYVVAGRMRLESGAGGADLADAEPGDFLHVPAGVIHRESNPGDGQSTAVIARAGSGVPTINVDGPAPG